MTTDPTKRRRWLQFRLRTLLIAVLVLSLPLSWFAVRMERARRQRKAVEAIRDVASMIFYEHQIRKHKVFVFADGGEALLPLGSPDIGLAVPLWLRRLLGDDFFSDVRCVSFRSETIDRHLANVPAFVHLEHISLRNSRITDNGLSQLASCSKLRCIDLRDTSVTPEGVKKLEAALPNCIIVYGVSSPPPP